MKKRNMRARFSGGLLFLSVLTYNQIGWPNESVTKEPENPPTHQAAPSDSNSKILVEIFLAQEHKKEVDAIKKEFEAFAITNVRPQFFRLGNPPQNVGFGKEIPADVARLAIRLATTYNRGIKFLLQEKRLAPHYIGIGASIFDEAFQVPVSEEELKRLSDPSLTTAQFHELYYRLTDQPPRIKR